MVKNSFFFVCLLWAGSIVLGSCKKNKSEEPEPAFKVSDGNNCRLLGLFYSGDDSLYIIAKETNPNGNVTSIHYNFTQSPEKIKKLRIKVEYNQDNRIVKSIISSEDHVIRETIYDYNAEGKLASIKRDDLDIQDEQREHKTYFEYSGNTIYQIVYKKYTHLYLPDEHHDTIRYEMKTDEHGNLLHLYEYSPIPGQDRDTLLLTESYTYSQAVPESFKKLNYPLWLTGIWIEIPFPHNSHLLTKINTFSYRIETNNTYSLSNTNSHDFTYRFDDKGNITSLGDWDTLRYTCDE